MAEAQIFLVVFAILYRHTTLFGVSRPQLGHVGTMDFCHQLNNIDTEKISQAVGHHAGNVDFVHHAAQLLHQFGIAYRLRFEFVSQCIQH
ncbi:Uncharacterised protein [Salmonella enterica subsp. enterica serovar Typhi]|nr:Uncharacterised protein [Salmonella enterica subsp. enterica serovar Typhi]